MSLKAMDYAWYRPPFDQVDVVFRYIGDSGAALSAPEAAEIHAKGKGIAPNFEQGAAQALKGPAQGLADGVYANNHLDSIGCPANVWIWYSVDTQATADQVRPYFTSLKALGRRTRGFYGGLKVGLQMKAEGLVDGVWCSNAASWSGYASWEAMVADARSQAHALQYLSHPLVNVDPTTYDYDEIMIPFPTWGGTAVATPVAHTPEDNMILCSRVISTVAGRSAFVTFDPAAKKLVGFNGVDFAPSAGWTITHGFGVVVAQLTVATTGNIGVGEKPDGTGIVVTADGDGGTFALPYVPTTLHPVVVPAPAPIDVSALAPHLKIIAQ